MRTLLIALGLVGCNAYASAQTYSDSILLHRQEYKGEFISEERSPLKGEDTAFLRFFEPDARYRVMADIKLTPEAAPFVDVGQEVNEDTVVCIIEAMKVMNEIKAEVKGVIAEVVAENGKPVQFGQALFKVR